MMAAFSVLLAVSAVSGCGSADEKVAETEVQSEEKLQIGLSFDSFVIERWLRDRDMFVSTAQSLGAEVDVQVAGGDVEEQISQIEYFIKKGVDVIAIISIDGEALGDVVQEAMNQGIKVISYDRLIDNVGTDLYVSFDNEMVGTLMGESLAVVSPDGGDVFAIYGSPTDNNVAQVEKGFTEALEGTGLNIVYSGYCDGWLAEMAFDHVNKGLEVSSDVVGIMCGNDDLAGQAVKALSENRLAGKVALVAQDADLAGCQRIVEGTQTMTIYKSVEQEASVAATLAVALGKGEDITADTCAYPVTETISDGKNEVPYYKITPVAVTAENMDEVIIDGGFHSREDVYLNVSRDEE